MSDARPANRVRLIVLIALAATLALGSFWALEVMRRAGDETLASTPRNEPDYFVEKFNFIRMSKTGEARYQIAGTRLSHFPQHDSYEIRRPVLHSIADGRPPMTMHANRATIERNGSEVHMHDDVHIDRPASGATEHFHLKSEYLLILPDDDAMRTDRPVDITLGTSRLTGTGMVADNAKRQFQLSSKVRGNYQAALH